VPCEAPARWRNPSALSFAAGLVVLIVASVHQSWRGLRPVSLWLDDLWVATLVKHASLRELAALRAPVPYGFVATLKLIRVVFGDGHLQLQAAPLLAHLLAICGIGIVTVQLTRNFGFGLLASCLVAMQEELSVQAVRVKQYTLDALISVCLLGLAVHCLRRPSAERLTALGAASLLALPFSFPSAFIGPVLLTSCAVFRAFEQRDQRDQAVRTLAIMTLFDLACAALLFVMVHQKTTPSLRHFWAANYPPTHDLRALASFFSRGPGYAFFTGAFGPAPWLAWLQPLGVFWLLRTRWTRALGVFVLVLLAAILLSSVLHFYPIGAPRLDSFVRPVHVLVAVAALQLVPLNERYSLAPAGLVVLFAAYQLTIHPVTYPFAGEQPLSKLVRRWIASSETGVLLFPWANWAFAYYTDEPVHLVAVDDSTNGFFAIPDRPNAWVLPETYHGALFSSYARNTRAFDALLAPLLTTRPESLVFYGSYGSPQVYRTMLRHLGRRHYRIVEPHTRAGAIAVRLERAE
jgi:hypothetical protein